MPERIPCVRLLTWLAIVAACASSAFAQRQPAGERPQPPREQALRDEAPPRAELARPKPPAGQPRPPFVLTPAEERYLDQVLDSWEKSSDKVKTFKCAFTRWEYNKNFPSDPKNGNHAEGKGMIRYKRPDWGEFDLPDVREYVPPTPPAKEGGFVAQPNARERWICDGKSIFQFEFNKTPKQLTETKLPPQLQGAAIADGPLPFVFGAKADALKKRYWLRDITPRDQVKDYVWLEALPRYQADAANFQRVHVILTVQDFLPYALQLFLPSSDPKDSQKTVYQFHDIKVNDPFTWLKGDFAPPTAPFGWKHVVEKPPAAPDAPNDKQRPPADGAEARRSGANPRK